MQIEKLESKSKAAADLLKAMSNENRLLILCQLVQSEKTVGELERIVGLSQSALSQHLAILRHSELVKTCRESQTIKYSLAGIKTKAIIETLYHCFYTSNCTLPSDKPSMTP